jgi:hypothetical protein
MLQTLADFRKIRHEYHVSRCLLNTVNFNFPSRIVPMGREYQVGWLSGDALSSHSGGSVLESQLAHRLS